MPPHIKYATQSARRKDPGYSVTRCPHAKFRDIVARESRTRAPPTTSDVPGEGTAAWLAKLGAKHTVHGLHVAMCLDRP